MMICTGHAMTELRRGLRGSGKFEGGKVMLFVGAQSKEELRYVHTLLVVVDSAKDPLYSVLTPIPRRGKRMKQIDEQVARCAVALAHCIE